MCMLPRAVHIKVLIAKAVNYSMNLFSEYKIRIYIQYLLSIDFQRIEEEREVWRELEETRVQQ